MRECIKTKAVCKFAKKIKIVRETYPDTWPVAKALPPHAISIRVYPSSSGNELAGHWARGVSHVVMATQAQHNARAFSF